MINLLSLERLIWANLFEKGPLKIEQYSQHTEYWE